MAEHTSRVTLLRHGNAVAPDGKGDRERDLSALGKEQALARRKQLTGPIFDLIMSSQTTRTLETASVVAGTPNTIITLPELFTNQDNEANHVINEMFKRLGYKRLADYFADSENGQKSLRKFGKIAWDKIQDTASHGHGAKNVLVVGHAVCLPAIAYEAVQSQSEDPLLYGEMRRKALFLNMPECGAIQITLAFGCRAEGLEILPDVEVSASA